MQRVSTRSLIKPIGDLDFLLNIDKLCGHRYLRLQRLVRLERSGERARFQK